MPLEDSRIGRQVVTLLQSTFRRDSRDGHHHDFQPRIQSGHRWCQKAARNGPVIITNRGKPVHVLLSIEASQKLTGLNANIVDLLRTPEAADIEFETKRAVISHRPVDLS